MRPTTHSLLSRSSALAAAGALALLCACGEPAPQRRPNVVIVMLDTLRPDRLGCYGGSRDTSPQLDAMAQEFFLFEAAQSTAPWTAPALISLMTSLYPDAHGVRTAPIPERLPDSVSTLAEVLHAHGYRTAAFTEGGYARGDFGLDKGFEIYHADELKHGESGPEDHRRRLPENLARAERWLAEEAEPPFFLFFHTYEVHTPLHPPEEHVRPFRPGYQEDSTRSAAHAAIEHWNEHRELTAEQARAMLLEWTITNSSTLASVEEAEVLRKRAEELGVRFDDESLSSWSELIELVHDLYDAELRRTDQELVKLWNALRRLGHWDDTVLVLVSDHGEALGDHGELWHGRKLQEAVLRVLLMIRVPGKELAPRRVPEVVRLVDLMPTLLELVGIPPEGLLLQGQSLLPLMRGGSLELEAFSHAASARRGTVPDRHTIRTRDWRLVLDGERQSIALYDLRSDPGERTDLAAREPEVVRRLLERLERQRRIDAKLNERLGPAGERGPVDPRLMNELEALGYIGGGR